MKLTPQQIDATLKLVNEKMLKAEYHSAKSLEHMDKCSAYAKQAADISERLGNAMKPNLKLVTDDEHQK